MVMLVLVEKRSAQADEISSKVAVGSGGVSILVVRCTFVQKVAICTSEVVRFLVDI
jgi:hypothetical protein